MSRLGGWLGGWVAGLAGNKAKHLNRLLIKRGYKGGCPESVWKVSGSCLDGVWKV